MSTVIKVRLDGEAEAAYNLLKLHLGASTDAELLAVAISVLHEIDETQRKGETVFLGEHYKLRPLKEWV